MFGIKKLLVTYIDIISIINVGELISMYYLDSYGIASNKLTTSYVILLKIACLAHVTYQFLGAFAKLRKATISFFMSSCPSVRMEQLGSHWTDFY